MHIFQPLGEIRIIGFDVAQKYCRNSSWVVPVTLMLSIFAAIPLSIESIVCWNNAGAVWTQMEGG